MMSQDKREEAVEISNTKCQMPKRQSTLPPNALIESNILSLTLPAALTVNLT
jgi:hypothetical protein